MTTTDRLAAALKDILRVIKNDGTGVVYSGAIKAYAENALLQYEAEQKQEATDCNTCEGHGVVATTRKDMEGFPIEAACPDCNPTTPTARQEALDALVLDIQTMAELYSKGFTVFFAETVRKLIKAALTTDQSNVSEDVRRAVSYIKQDMKDFPEDFKKKSFNWAIETLLAATTGKAGVA